MRNAARGAPLAPVLFDQHPLPIYRWRWVSHRGEAREWQYVDPVENDIVAQRLHDLRGIEVQCITAELLRDALADAFEAGVSYEKFGRPADALYQRLGYRRCSRRRVDSIANAHGSAAA